MSKLSSGNIELPEGILILKLGNIKTEYEQLIISITFQDYLCNSMKIFEIWYHLAKTFNHRRCFRVE